ncbi:hypothetical protein A2U01_0116140, partial [Trifolium medium]|nr:hypothetical protein [Trifolium medium]
DMEGQVVPEPKIDEDEALDLDPLQVEMQDEDMQEAELEAEAAAKDEPKVENAIPDFHNPFEGQPDPHI